MASADIANRPPTACIGLEPRPNEMPGDQRSPPLLAIGTGPLSPNDTALAAHPEILSERPHSDPTAGHNSRYHPHARPPFWCLSWASKRGTPKHAAGS
ncbi:hypothetical protein LRC484719_39720 [Mycobacterium riyadhense]